MQVVCPLWSVSGFHLEMRCVPCKAKQQRTRRTFESFGIIRTWHCHAKRHVCAMQSARPPRPIHQFSHRDAPCLCAGMRSMCSCCIPCRRDRMSCTCKRNAVSNGNWRHVTTKSPFWSNPKLQSHRITPSCFQFRKKWKSQVLSMVVSCQFAESMQQCHDKIWWKPLWDVLRSLQQWPAPVELREGHRNMQKSVYIYIHIYIYVHSIPIIIEISRKCESASVFSNIIWRPGGRVWSCSILGQGQDLRYWAEHQKRLPSAESLAAMACHLSLANLQSTPEFSFRFTVLPSKYL